MKKGFTLIELLVVIAIIGILAALVMSALKGVDPRTQTTLNPSVLEVETYPEPTDYLVDTAGVLTPDQKSKLVADLKASDTVLHQYGVAIVKTTKPLTIDQYGIKLAEKWKVGHADLDNGAIIIIATEDRKVRIEVGYGLEGSIPDAVAGRIIDEFMIPSLKEGDWYGAVRGALAGLNQYAK